MHHFLWKRPHIYFAPKVTWSKLTLQHTVSLYLLDPDFRLRLNQREIESKAKFLVKKFHIMCIMSETPLFLRMISGDQKNHV